MVASLASSGVLWGPCIKRKRGAVHKELHTCNHREFTDRRSQRGCPKIKSDYVCTVPCQICTLPMRCSRTVHLLIDFFSAFASGAEFVCIDWSSQYIQPPPFSHWYQSIACGLSSFALRTHPPPLGRVEYDTRHRLAPEGGESRVRAALLGRVGHEYIQE